MPRHYGDETSDRALRDAQRDFTQRDKFEANRDLYIKARYAPGDYSCECSACKGVFIGDKLAKRCFNCATELLKRYGEI